MVPQVVNAANALDSLATNIDAHWTSASYNEAVGQWNVAPVTRQMLGLRTRNVAERLRKLDDETITPELLDALNQIPQQSQFIISQTIPNGTGGNVLYLVDVFDAFLNTIEQCCPRFESVVVSPSLPTWEEVENSKQIPRELNSRIRSLKATVSKVEPQVQELEATIKAIQDAHSAAMDLPTDLQTLEESRKEIEKKGNEVEENRRRVGELLASTEKELSEAILTHAAMISLRDEAKKVMEKIDSAYSAATSVGLAASFTERASSLNISTRWWVGFLMVALILGGVLGYLRLDHLQGLTADGNVKPEWVWINLLMSIVAVAAPVWFAWLATRQIGQRFRLAEDYAFKASIARAYEGYRKEAARIDPELEARLFASALDRLDEAPLRFLATEEHSSPYEALLASPSVQRAIEKIPDLKGAIAAALKQPGADREVPPSPTTTAT